MRSTVLTCLATAAIAIVALACGVPQEQYDADIAALKRQVDDARGENADLRSRLEKMTAERQRLQSEIDKLNQALQELTGERDALAKAEALAKKRIDTFRDMLGKFRAMIESGKIKIRIADNKMLVEMASAILFPSGKAKLSEEGKEALTEVAGILATIEDRNFQVAGHTDNVPIRNRRFKDNWDLSTARAVAVVRHLVENGMPRDNLSAAGYADIQPVASNEIEEGRAKNRRIEIVLVPNLNELPDLSALEDMIDG